jgi:RNA-binding protein YhbY
MLPCYRRSVGSATSLLDDRRSRAGHCAILRRLGWRDAARDLCSGAAAAAARHTHALGLCAAAAAAHRQVWRAGADGATTTSMLASVHRAHHAMVAPPASLTSQARLASQGSHVSSLGELLAAHGLVKVQLNAVNSDVHAVGRDLADGTGVARSVMHQAPCHAPFNPSLEHVDWMCLCAAYGRRCRKADTKSAVRMAGGTLVQVKGRTLLLGAPQRDTDQLMAIAATSNGRAEAATLRKASLCAGSMRLLPNS